jgi:hypothetical protein
MAQNQHSCLLRDRLYVIILESKLALKTLDPDAQKSGHTAAENSPKIVDAWNICVYN